MHNQDEGKLTLEELASLLKEARKARGREQGKKITHKMVAEAIGVDRVTVSMWEQGRKHPGFLNIVNYCNYLGISLDELLGVKRQQTLYIELTEEEREAILAMFDECEQELETNSLHQKLRLLKQYIKAFLSRAQSK